MSKILLVDDDPLQASLRKSGLERRFHFVERVIDPAQALCLLEQASFAFHLALVIAGRQLRGIRGPEFVAELHERKPELPVLVLGAAGETAEDYAGTGACFRSRPITTEELVALANELLHRR